jgi:hypothetical protein
MNLKIVFWSILTFVFLNTMIFAQSSVYSEVSSLSNNIDSETAEHIQRIFGKEQIVQVSIIDTEENFWVELKNGSILDSGQDVNSNATMYLNTKINVIETISSSNEPLKIALDMINSKEIEYGTTKEATIGTKMKVGVSKVLLKIGGFFSKFF